MVIMLSQTSVEKVGYSNTVDWYIVHFPHLLISSCLFLRWSLGVTTFKLLTGYRPFTEDNFNAFVEMASTMNGRIQYQDAPPEYAMLFQEIPFPSFMSVETKDFIQKLLDVNEKTRLGSGPNGVDNIKAHPFFRGINFELLEQKHIEPPFKPQVKQSDDIPVYPNFEILMKDLGKESWLVDDLKDEEQKYFSNWSVIFLLLF